MPLGAGLQLERRSFRRLFPTTGKTEGSRARPEKRRPRFERQEGGG